MKKLFKKISIIMCVFALTVGFVGMGTIDSYAASTKGTIKLSVSLKDMTGVASKSKKYTIKLTPSNGSSSTVATATYSSNRYKVSGSAPITFVNNKAGSIKVTVTGPNAKGQTQTWSTTYKTVPVKKTIKCTVGGSVNSPTLSIS